MNNWVIPKANDSSLYKHSTFKYMHIPLKICLRDRRHYQFHNSLLDILESSLRQCPVSFNWQPCFTLLLSDSTIYNSLILSIKSSTYDMMEGAQYLAITYRIHYKHMKTTIDLSDLFNVEIYF